LGKKKEVYYYEDYAQRAELKQIIKVWVKLVVLVYSRRIWWSWFRPNIIRTVMQEIERGDSGVRSTSSVQSSLVMYPYLEIRKREHENT
jgi:glutaryl-CoA dehydrogenase